MSCLVLQCVPARLAKIITDSIRPRVLGNPNDRIFPPATDFSAHAASMFVTLVPSMDHLSSQVRIPPWLSVLGQFMLEKFRTDVSAILSFDGSANETE